MPDDFQQLGILFKGFLYSGIFAFALSVHGFQNEIIIVDRLYVVVLPYVDLATSKKLKATSNSPTPRAAMKDLQLNRKTEAIPPRRRFCRATSEGKYLELGFFCLVVW